jgi:hypothetical protein
VGGDHARAVGEAAVAVAVGLDHQPAVADGQGLGGVALPLAGGLADTAPGLAGAPFAGVDPTAVELVGEHRAGRPAAGVGHAQRDRRQRAHGDGQA